MNEENEWGFALMAMNLRNYIANLSKLKLIEKIAQKMFRSSKSMNRTFLIISG